MRGLRSEVGLLLLGACVSLAAIACATGKKSQDPSPRVEKLHERPNKPTTIRIDGKEVAIEDVTKEQADFMMQCITEDELIKLSKIVLDCNKNGISDQVEIDQGSVADENKNGIPDTCE